MATHSRLLSLLFEDLLLTTLLLCLFFSSCNATSRSIMERMDLQEAGAAALPSRSAATQLYTSANSCAGRESCQMMSQAELKNSQNSMDSAAVAVAKISDPRISDHDHNSEWVSDSEPKSMMDSEHFRGSTTQLRHLDQTSMRDANAMREDSEWIQRDSATDRHLSDLERMRDPRIDRMISDLERMSMRNSEDTMSNIDKRIRNPQRVRDSQQRPMWTTEKMRDFGSDSSIEDNSERLRGSDRMTESDRRMNSDGMRDSHGMIDSDRMSSDSHKMIDSDGMRDSQRMIDSNSMRDSHGMIDSDRMRDSNRMIDSDRMRDSSHTMADSDMLMNSDAWRKSQKMYTMDQEEEMLNSKRRDSAQRLRDSNQMMDQDQLRESAQKLRNSDWRSTADLGNYAHDEQSEMMQDSHRIRTSEGRRDLENTRAANNMMDSGMDSAAAQWHTNLNGEEGLGSQMMGDADQFNYLHGRGTLEQTRNSADHMQGSEQTSANTNRMNTNAARSTMGNMAQTQQMSSTMEPSSCQGMHCRSTSDPHRSDSTGMEAHETTHMPLSFRRSDAKSGSRSENSEAASIYSTAAGRCSGMNAADCDAAQINGELQGSDQNMYDPQSDELSNSCTLGAADCRMTTKEEAINNKAKSMERMGSTTPGRMSTCSNEQCHPSIDTNEDSSMAARQHRTRNEREIVTSPKWVKFERSTSGINEAEWMDNSQKTSPMANSCTNGADCRSTTGIMHKNKRDNSEFMWDRHDEISVRSSCANEADCRSTTSGINNMYMSPRDSGWTGQDAQPINGRSLCANEADCRSSSGINDMHMSPRDSGLMGQNGQQINDRISCANEADCRGNPSGINDMHMSPRDSGLMGQNGQQINDRISCANEADCRGNPSGINDMHMSPSDAELMGQNGQEINRRSSCANEADCRSTTSEINDMRMSARESELMAHNAQEINGRTSCANEADCRSSSGINKMNMSPRDSELMGQHPQQINGQSSCANGADCRSTSGIMHINTRNSVTMDQAQMADNSKMVQSGSNQMNDSANMMHGLGEAAADRLPIHRGN